MNYVTSMEIYRQREKSATELSSARHEQAVAMHTWGAGAGAAAGGAALAAGIGMSSSADGVSSPPGEPLRGIPNRNPMTSIRRGSLMPAPRLDGFICNI